MSEESKRLILDTVRDLVAQRNELLDTLLDVIHQACWSDGVLDSMALTAYADGMVLLARYGKLTITSEHGRRVIAEFVRTT